MKKRLTGRVSVRRDDYVSQEGCQAVHEYLARPEKEVPQGECSAGHPTAPRHAQRRARTCHYASMLLVLYIYHLLMPSSADCMRRHMEESLFFDA